MSETWQEGIPDVVQRKQEPTVEIVNHPDGDWVTILLNSEIFHEGHNIPHFVIVELLQELGIHCFRTERELEEG